MITDEGAIKDDAALEFLVRVSVRKFGILLVNESKQLSEMSSLAFEFSDAIIVLTDSSLVPGANGAKAIPLGIKGILGALVACELGLRDGSGNGRVHSPFCWELKR